MAQEIDIKDLKRKRKLKKRKKFARRLIALLIIVLIGAVIYYTKDRWLPFFDGIATRYLPTEANNGELAVGNFPIKISGGASYQVGTLENSFAVVDDTHVFIYSSDGKNIVNNQHDYANPILKTNNKKALIYDLGGLEFRIESKYKTEYEKQTDNTIILARLSSNDNVAVVTKSDKFVSVMRIYDDTGNKFFEWDCIDRIIDVTFTQAGDGCIVTTIDAQGGQLVSKLHRFNLDNKKEIWSSSNIDTMVISTQIRDDGTIVAFGDTKCAYYNRNGEYISSYIYKAKLIDYDCSGTMTALLFADEERRKSSLVMINDIKASIKEINVNEEAKHIIVDGDNAFMMTESKINEYTISGTQTSTVSIGEEYDDFHKLGNYIFLLGHDDINRIDFNG